MGKQIMVTYDANSFCEAQFGECLPYARRYVKEHPKESYSTDDFMEVYRMKEREEGRRITRCSHISYGNYHSETLERFVDIMEGNE